MSIPAPDLVVVTRALQRDGGMPYVPRVEWLWDGPCPDGWEIQKSYDSGTTWQLCHAYRAWSGAAIGGGERQAWDSDMAESQGGYCVPSARNVRGVIWYRVRAVWRSERSEWSQPAEIDWQDGSWLPPVMTEDPVTSPAPPGPSGTEALVCASGGIARVSLADGGASWHTVRSGAGMHSIIGTAVGPFATAHDLGAVTCNGVWMSAPGRPRGLCMAGDDLVAVALQSGGANATGAVALIQPSDMSTLAVQDLFGSGLEAILNGVLDVALVGDVLIAAANGSRCLVVLNAADLALVAYLPEPRGVGEGPVKLAYQAGAGTLWSGHDSAGIIGYDVSNPRDPYPVASWGPADCWRVYGLAVSGSHLWWCGGYVDGGSGTKGVYGCLDISDRNCIRELWTTSSPVQSRPSGVVLCPEGRVMVVGNGGAILMDGVSGEEVWSIWSPLLAKGQQGVVV